MSNERFKQKIASELLPYAVVDYKNVSLPKDSMQRVMNSLSSKDYTSDVRHGNGRAVFLLSPLELDETGVVFTENDLRIFKTTNPATVSYDVWIAATKEGFRGVAKRKTINDKNWPAGSSDSYLQKLQDLPHNPEEAKQTLALFGVDAESGNVKRFSRDLHSTEPLGMRGVLMEQFNIPDIGLVNQTIWKARYEWSGK